ncbi:MAG: PAS domain S-box protein [Deltaproteobacteria bacterium]|nr:PAS domain S-box protein [Deltaproteobacteria bacterium]
MRRQVWLTLFRLVLVTVLLGGTAFWQWREGLARGGEVAVGPLYSVVLVTYAVSLGLAVALRLRWAPAGVAAAQVALDVGLATAVVALTGWADSVFVFLFVIAIVNGSLLLFRRGALLAAALSLLVYVPLALLVPPVAPPPLTLFAHAGALLATAALAAYLSEQLRSTGERLAAREVDLAEITALHEAIVQSVQSGLLTLDGEGRVTFLNRAGEQLTGYRREEVVGQAPAWLTPLTQGGERAETDFQNGRGERLRLGYAAFPLRSEGGAQLGQAVIFQDLTQLRAMEERVQRNERLAGLGRVAAGLAHELRNPLASMSGSLELLRDGAVRPEDRRLMEIVLREANRLEQLVGRFLEYSRPAPPRRAAVDLARVAQETLEVFSHDPASARTTVRTELAEARASCDPDQIRQVLWNLLVNACQASATATVTVRSRPEPGGGAILEVEDDGPGIAPEDLSQIFTPFFTTKPSGTGLGLATVQRLVDAHGGTVSVRSGPGQGACFTVHLPTEG